MYFPYVSFSCGTGFVINAAATAAYVSAQCSICADEIMGTLALDCDCDPLFWTTSPTPSPITYTTPAGDGAPWYTSSIPESARFLGYRVQNVESQNQVSRTITQRLGSSGGGVLGPLARSVVRLDFQVLLFACDELAMEYGYRFMSNRLACLLFTSPCDRGTLIYRNTCQELSGSPSQAAVIAGRWQVDNALLISGPTWGADPIAGMRKYVRRADFSIAGESVAPVAV